jgi:hypothetical protein
MMVALLGPSASARDDADDRRKLTSRLKTMQRLAKEVKVCEIWEGKPGPPLALHPEPLLRYTNVTLQVVDGTLWAWGERGRPAAVMKLGLRAPTGGQRRWTFRVNVLSPKRIDVEFPDGLTWSSREHGLELQSLPGAPAPADSAAQRLIQAKDITRRLSTSLEATNPRGRVQLRLLPRPIDRYNDPTAGLLDGLLFSFVYTNNPSVLVVLEAWSEGAGARAWRYAVVRQGGGEMTALFDGKPLASVSSDLPSVDSELFIINRIPASPEEQD